MVRDQEGAEELGPIRVGGNHEVSELIQQL